MNILIITEKTRLLSRFIGYALAIELLGSIALAVLAFQAAGSNNRLIGAWLLLSAVQVFVRYKAAGRRSPGDSVPTPAEIGWQILMTGCLWGLASFLFLPTMAVIDQAVFIFALMGMSLASVPFVPNMRAATALLLPAWLPTAYASYASDQSFAIPACMLFLLACIYQTIHFTHAMIDSLIAVRLERDKTRQTLDETMASQHAFMQVTKHKPVQPLYAIAHFTRWIKDATPERNPKLDESLKELEEVIGMMGDMIDVKLGPASDKRPPFLALVPAVKRVDPWPESTPESTAGPRKLHMVHKQHEPSMPDIRLDAYTIAVIDDNQSMRQASATLLSGAGAKVVAAAGRDEFFDAVGDMSDLTLLVADLHVEGSPGPDLADEVKSRFPAARVIILTGDDSREAHTEWTRRGFMVLLKPTRSTVMLATIASVLGISADSTETATT